MVLSRERSAILIFLTLCAVGLSTWIIWKGVDSYRNTFISGAPPKDIEQVIAPQTIDVSKLKPPAIQATDMIRYGGPTSTISVIEYGDYQCEDCRQLAQLLKQTLPTYQGRVRFIFHQLPVESRHPQAMDAAMFATCAGEQGAFWEAHDALMEAPAINEVTFTSIANELKLDQNSLNTCRRDQARQEKIRHDIEIDRGDGISGVPLLFIGTQASYGVPTAEELDTQIRRYLP